MLTHFDSKFLQREHYGVNSFLEFLISVKSLGFQELDIFFVHF